MAEEINHKTASTLELSLFTVIVGFLIFFSVIFIGWLLLDLIAPVFVGLLLAFVCRPLIDWTRQKLFFPPWLTVSLLLIVMGIIGIVLIIWFLPIIIQHLVQFMQRVPGYIEDLLQLFYGEGFTISGDIRAKISEYAAIEKMVPFLLRGTAKSVGMLTNAFGWVTYLIIYICLLFIFFITFSLYLPDIKQWFRQFLPHSNRERVQEILDKIYESAQMFLRTRLLIALILGILFSAGWALAGVPFWSLLGIGTGLLNIIPYASWLGWFAAMIINAVETGNSMAAIFYALLWPTLVFVVIQAIDGWVLTPFLQGEYLKIHPVTVLFAVFAGGSLAGLLGMLLAIPLTAALKIVFSDVIKPNVQHWAEEH